MIFINIITISFFILGLPDMIRNILDLRKKGAKIYDPIVKMFECYKCVAFWTALIMTGGNFVLATQVHCIGYVLDKYIISKW